ncbi:MAG: M28 family peptidase, partial [Pirellulales bacterium]
GILVDMIGDKDLDLYYETNSMRFAKELCVEVWKVAEDLKIKEFRPRTRPDVRDDHLPLNNIAKIPTIDLIDFDYPTPGGRVNYWHTEKDIPANCSGESVCKVAAVLLEWLRRQK